MDFGVRVYGVSLALYTVAMKAQKEERLKMVRSVSVMTRISALSVLLRKGYVSQAALNKHVSVEYHAMRNVLDSLLTFGVVERINESRDPMSGYTYKCGIFCWRLTEKGKRLIEGLEKNMEEIGIRRVWGKGCLLWEEIECEVTKT